MENLDLQKFDNYKLDNKQLEYVHAGEGDTGGSINIEQDDETGRVYRYDSDYVNSSGATFYNNYRLVHVMHFADYGWFG